MKNYLKTKVINYILRLVNFAKKINNLNIPKKKMSSKESLLL